MHIIHRQTVTVTAPHAALALVAQDQILAALRDGGALERMFDDLAGDRDIRLDRIEIDLGAFAGNFRPQDWMDHLVRQLQAELRQSGTLSRAGQRAEGTAEAASYSTADSPVHGIAADQSDDSAKTLAYFLTCGRLPWWHSQTPPPDFAESLAMQLGVPARRQIAALAAGRPAALARLTGHLDSNVLATFLAPVLPRSPLLAFARAETRARLALGLPGVAAQRWRAAFWQPVLAAAAAGSAPDIKTTVACWIATLADCMTAPAGPNRRTLTGAIQALAAALPPKWRAAVTAAKAMPDVALSSQPPIATQAGPAHRDAAVGATALPDDTPRFGAMQPGTGINPPGAIPDTDVEYQSVTGAGVILLHPFLPELFRELGLLEARRFVDSAAQARAARVLGLLAFGVTDTPEPQLTLAKLLTGMALDDPILPLAPEPEDIAAAAALLDAVLRHWPALKTTSHDALRDAFLTRDGRLCPIDDGWQLTVSRRAQDVLLDRLPWGIGLIVLPWCDFLLHVNWTD